MIDPSEIARLIREATEAVVLPRFRTLTPDQIRQKSGPHDLVTVADVDCEQRLTPALQATLPGSTVVGEEAVAADPTVLDRLHGAAPVWLIDPIDGTFNFAHGDPNFTVIVALVENGVVEAGWIHHPTENLTIYALRGHGAWSNGQRLRLSWDLPESGMVGSAYGQIKGRGEAAALLTASGRIAAIENSQCGGIDYLRMAQGAAQFKYSSGSLPWDHAAGILICQEAFAEARFFDGTPYDPRVTRSPLLVAPSPAAWQVLHAVLAGPEIG
ncbi:MAG: inositol monophosphatase [Azospirillum sp.]|nr:inositol monophosphatase [Azospirillum sp.]